MMRRQKRAAGLCAALVLLPAALCLCCCGCAGFWDDITSKDFEFNSLFSKPNPLVVLRDSPDGDRRARALRALHEPKQNGGTDAEQDAIVKILVTAAASEKQPLCRLAAIQSLAHFKDPRAAQGLTDAFYNATSFAPETTSIIRCQALAALGENRNPAAVELLTRVVKEPPAEGTGLEKQLTLDVRIAAARALGNFSHYQATEALVQVLRTEKDVALRDRVQESLELATGKKKVPQDADAWEQVLHDGANKPEEKKHILVGGWF